MSSLIKKILCGVFLVYICFFANSLFVYGISNNSINIKNRAPINPNVEISGVLTWEDDSGYIHPVRNMLVELYRDSSNSVLISSFITSNSGAYSFAFDYYAYLEYNELNVKIRAYAGDENNYVTNLSGFRYYYDFACLIVQNAGSYIRNYCFDMMEDGYIAQAIQIAQAVSISRKFAIEYFNLIPDDIVVEYPYSRDGEPNYTFSYGGNTIRAGERNCQSSHFINYYAAWDAIMHEYGHHMEAQLGIDDCFSLEHLGNENFADVFHDIDDNWLNTYEIDLDEWNPKEEGCKTAWTEGWANAFSLICQDCMSSYLTNIVSTCDAIIIYGTRDSIDFDECNPYGLRGEACENAVTSILWDIYDDFSFNVNQVDDDNLQLGIDGFADPCECEVYTLNSYIQNFYELYPNEKTDLGDVLTITNVSTSKPNISNYSQLSASVFPIISWVPQGGSNYYPNNSFKIVFYDSYNNQILTTPFITGNQYQLTCDEWSSILLASGNSFYFSIMTYQNDRYLTGPYYSTISDEYLKPEISDINYNCSINNSNRFYERKISLLPGQSVIFNVTFSSSGYKLLQTFGTKDTMMDIYDSNGEVIYSNDDSGYLFNSLISKYLYSNQNYIVKIHYYSSTNYGDLKFTIAQTDSSYINYESITQYSNNTNNINGDMNQNNVDVFTFKSTQNLNKTFTVDALYDSYLYLINPNSVELSSSVQSKPCVYNDDGAGNMQARISKTLDLNIPYLMIVSGYNPSIQYGDYTIYIN